MAEDAKIPSSYCEWCSYFGVEPDPDRCYGCAMYAPEPYSDITAGYDGTDYNDYLIEQALLAEERKTEQLKN